MDIKEPNQVCSGRYFSTVSLKGLCMWGQGCGVRLNSRHRFYRMVSFFPPRPSARPGPHLLPAEKAYELGPLIPRNQPQPMPEPGKGPASTSHLHGLLAFVSLDKGAGLLPRGSCAQKHPCQSSRATGTIEKPCLVSEKRMMIILLAAAFYRTQIPTSTGLLGNRFTSKV